MREDVLSDDASMMRPITNKAESETISGSTMNQNSTSFLDRFLFNKNNRHDNNSTIFNTVNGTRIVSGNASSIVQPLPPTTSEDTVTTADPTSLILTIVIAVIIIATIVASVWTVCPDRLGRKRRRRYVPYETTTPSTTMAAGSGRGTIARPRDFVRASIPV